MIRRRRYRPFSTADGTIPCGVARGTNKQAQVSHATLRRYASGDPLSWAEKKDWKNSNGKF